MKKIIMTNTFIQSLLEAAQSYACHLLGTHPGSPYSLPSEKTLSTVLDHGNCNHTSFCFKHENVAHYDSALDGFINEKIEIGIDNGHIPPRDANNVSDLIHSVAKLAPFEHITGEDSTYLEEYSLSLDILNSYD